MDLQDLKFRNLFRNRMRCITSEIEEVWKNADELLLKEEEGRYEAVRQLLYDSQTAIAAYFGEILNKIGEIKLDEICTDTQGK